MARILVVDDSLIAQKSYEKTLGYLGHEPIIFSSGLPAVKNFKEKPADLVILDVDLPGMNGYDICREIRKLHSGLNIPIIMVSVADEEADIINGLNAGANDYLIKPVKEAHLIAKLKTYLKISALHGNDIDLVRNHVEFAGRYTIEKLIGYGAHSLVFLAKDKETASNVAIKLISAPNIKDFFNSFSETAGKIKNINSSNTIKIYDFGEYGGRFYLVLEYADKGDLASILKRRTLSEKEATLLAIDIISGLDDLYKNGVIHFDIKPENIMQVGGKFKLGDFGIITSRRTATVPIRMGIWSTAAYLPPEFLSDTGVIDFKSDIYSFGVTLYESVSGDNPFHSEKPAVSMFRQMNVVPPLVSSFNKNISLYFSRVVSSMIEKSPENRPDLNELKNLFANILEVVQIREKTGFARNAALLRSKEKKLDEILVKRGSFSK